MKILFVVNIPSPYRVAFFSELGKKCDLTVIYERKTASDRDEKWKASSTVQKSYDEIFLNGIKFKNDLSISFEILKFMNRDFDLIIFGMYSSPTEQLAISYLKQRKIKFVISSDGGFINKESRLKRKWKTYLIGSASFWLSTGKKCDEYLEAYGAHPEKIFRYSFTSLSADDVLSSPLTASQKADIKKELGLSSSQIVLYVGQFIERKGLDVLINAARCLTYAKDEGPIAYYLVGGTLAELKKNVHIERIPNNVHVVPFADKQTLSMYYEAASALVLPTRDDIWGLVVNEAMAKGTPVVSTYNCGAASELIDDGKNGYVVRADDVSTLVEAIGKILNGTSSTFSESCLNTIANYTFETMANQHIYAFKRMMRENHDYK